MHVYHQVLDNPLQEYEQWRNKCSKCSFANSNILKDIYAYGGKTP